MRFCHAADASRADSVRQRALIPSETGRDVTPTPQRRENLVPTRATSRKLNRVRPTGTPGGPRWPGVTSYVINLGLIPS